MATTTPSVTEVRMSRLLLFLIALSVTVPGCKFGQLPDPNEPEARFDGEALQKDVGEVNAVLTERLLKGEIDEPRKVELLQTYIKEQLEGIDPKDVPDRQAWRFADIYRLLGDWKTTNELYERAVATARDEDRRVNDSLRLAETKAKLDDVEAGIKLVRSTFDANPGGKAPILMGTLYEFTPAALGKGHDREVAKLLEEAISQHLATVVDPKTDSGMAFLQARFHHIQSAWEIILRVYRQEGDEAAMRGAIERADTMMRRFASA